MTSGAASEKAQRAPLADRLVKNAEDKRPMSTAPAATRRIDPNRYYEAVGDAFAVLELYVGGLGLGVLLASCATIALEGRLRPGC